MEAHPEPALVGPSICEVPTVHVGALEIDASPEGSAEGNQPLELQQGLQNKTPRWALIKTALATKVKGCLTNRVVYMLLPVILAWTFFGLQVYLVPDHPGCHAPDVAHSHVYMKCQGSNFKLVGTICNPICDEVSVPSVTSLKCISKETWEPANFSCVKCAKCCAVHQNIPNANSWGACREGDRIGHRHRCTTSCKYGFMPSVASVICWNGKLGDFSCDAAPGCHAPVVAHANLNPTCKEGDFARVGDTCTPLCDEVSVPSVLSLECTSNYTWEPEGFSCDKCVHCCDAPQNVLQASKHGACQEGDRIGHDQRCTTQCQPGFKPNVTSLNCSDGDLGEFSCDQEGCNAPVVSYANPSKPCEKGSFIPVGDTCTPLCDELSVPSVVSLKCISSDTWEPEGFSCDKCVNCCDAPQNVPEASKHGACREVDRIGHDQRCTTQCQPGFIPNVTSLICSDGELGKFSCDPEGCNAPVVSHANATSCKEGSFIPVDEFCTPVCDEVSVPSPISLRCAEHDKWIPASFVCHKCLSCCEVPQNNEPSYAYMGKCEEGDRFGNGHVCTVVCDDGSSPVASHVTCQNGVWKGPVCTRVLIQ